MDPELVLSIAKALNFNYSKAKEGEATVWAKLSPEDQNLWLRLARLAVRRATEQSGAEA